MAGAAASTKSLLNKFSSTASAFAPRIMLQPSMSLFQEKLTLVTFKLCGPGHSLRGRDTFQSCYPSKSWPLLSRVPHVAACPVSEIGFFNSFQIRGSRMHPPRLHLLLPRTPHIARRTGGRERERERERERKKFQNLLTIK